MSDYPILVTTILANSQDVTFSFEGEINWDWEMLALYGKSIDKVLLRHPITKLLSYHDLPVLPARMVTLLNKAALENLTQQEMDELWNTLVPSLGVYSNGFPYYDVINFRQNDWYVANQSATIFVSPATIEDGLKNMIARTNKDILTERDKVLMQFLLSSPDVETFRTDLETLMTKQQEYVAFITDNFITVPGIYSPTSVIEADEETETAEAVNSPYEVIDLSPNPIITKYCSLCGNETVQVSAMPTTDGTFRYKCTYVDCGHYDYF